MKLFRRPRLWFRLVGGVVFLVAVWVLVVPVTAVYMTTNENSVPKLVSTVYSWGTSEQDLIYSGVTAVDLPHLGDNEFPVLNRLANGIRLSCGNIFGPGAHEQVEAPDGPQVCSDVRKPRRIVGLSLLGVGVVALVASLLLPAGSGRAASQYRQPYNQRRLLKRGR